MKLNIGCGKIYKQGYINIDSFDSTIADKIMSADNLKFSENSIEEIEACQLIEHLGLYDSINALAEWFRVLKPNGKLLIETPDMETSFKKFLDGDRETRKAVLSWIFGLETPGMTHKLCFPRELLVELLEKTGFKDIKKTNIEIDKKNPTLRVRCKKRKNYEPYQTLADYRKILINEKIISEYKDLTRLEQEKLIDFFITKIIKFYKEKNYKIFDEIIMEGAVKNVKMSYILLQECIKHKIVLNNKIQDHLEVLELLDRINFPSVLYHLIKESTDEPGTQINVFQTVSNIGKQSIKKLISDKKARPDLKTSLKKLAQECKNDQIDFFSEDLLDRKAADLSYIGVKEFILGNYNRALENINEAIKFDRNHILYYWNQGRLLSLTQRPSDAKRAYENVIKLVKISNHKDKEKLEKSIQNEIVKFSTKIHGTPITEILN